MSVTLIERPAAIESSIAPSPGSVAGIFTKRFGRSTSSVQELRLLERRVPLVREIGIDLDRDEAVDAVGPLPHRPQEIAGALDVLDREREEDLLRVVGALELGAKLLVVPVAGRERLLEDRRVRGHADDRVLVDQPLELAGLEHLARERVDPDADAVLRELVQSAARHAPTLPRSGAAVEWRA